LIDLYTTCDGRPLRGPNDLVFDSSGGFYFTDTGKAREREVDRGALYYALPDGSAIDEVVFPMDRPNGVGLSPDGSTLYVAESVTARIWAFDVEGPGRLGGRRVLITLPGRQYLDSLAIDTQGNVCVGTILTGAITVVAAEGAITDVIPVPGPDPFVTNICFGGPGQQTAYITSSGRGRLYATDWPCPGLALNF
jgi:gluconolactonase